MSFQYVLSGTKKKETNIFKASIDLRIFFIFVDRAGGDDGRRFGVPSRCLPHRDRERDPRRSGPARVRHGAKVRHTLQQ